MDEFTNTEKQRLDQLYGNDFEGITAQDAPLIARYEAWKAKQEAEHVAKMEMIQAETQAKIKAAKKQSDYAMQTLKELRDKARQRYERATNGQTEQE